MRCRASCGAGCGARRGHASQSQVLLLLTHLAALQLYSSLPRQHTHPTHNTQPAQVSLDGTAPVQQSVVFAVLRPLDDATVHFEVAMHHGREGAQRLVLTFSYSMLQLLLRSPWQPVMFEEWRLLAKDCLPGMHVSGGGCICSLLTRFMANCVLTSASFNPGLPLPKPLTLTQRTCTFQHQVPLPGCQNLSWLSLTTP